MSRFVTRHLASREGQRLSVLDVGSQDINGSYRSLFEKPRWSYAGADMTAGDGVDVVLADIYRWRELTSCSFDVVISGQAFEHIEFPWLTMLEISRVLRPGGLCCIIAPSSGVEHRYPLDCWRFYTDGMKALARFAGLDVLEAYTFNEPHDSSGAPNVWHDTVLIGRKPTDGLRRVRFELALRRVMGRSTLPHS